jgi:acetyltransferase-like isoleucine patch superfamily enzyme
VYIGKNSTIEIEKTGKVLIEHGVYIKKGFDLFCNGTIKIGTSTFINKDVTIASMNSVIIGDHCLIGEQVSIRDHDHKFSDNIQFIKEQGFETEPVIIGSNVWIGCKVTIVKGVKIGNNCIIGANSVVTRYIPDNSIAVGVPARVIKSRERI